MTNDHKPAPSEAVADLKRVLLDQREARWMRRMLDDHPRGVMLVMIAIGVLALAILGWEAWRL